MMVGVLYYGQHQTVRGLSLGHVFIALGALLTPALSDLLVHQLDFRRAVAILAFLCLVPAILCAVPVASDTIDHGFNPPAQMTLFEAGNFSKIVLAGLVFFFYAPMEAAISVWATTYLTERGYGERGATWMLSAFWAALLVSRLLLAVVPFKEGWYAWLIVIPSLLTVVALGNLAGSAERSAPRSALLVLGLLLGPIFPTLLGVVANVFPHEMGLAYGIIFAAGSLGGLMLAPIVAPRIAPTGMTAFRAPIVLALAMTVAALVFGLTVGQGR